jgi:hypothetical protein
MNIIGLTSNLRMQRSARRAIILDIISYARARQTWVLGVVKKSSLIIFGLTFSLIIAAVAIIAGRLYSIDGYYEIIQKTQDKSLIQLKNGKFETFYMESSGKFVSLDKGRYEVDGEILSLFFTRIGNEVRMKRKSVFGLWVPEVDGTSTTSLKKMAFNWYDTTPDFKFEAQQPRL